MTDAMRRVWKEMIAGQSAEADKLVAIETELQGMGYENFTNSAKLYEHLGVTHENWNRKVDVLVKRGLPEATGEEFKLAAEDADGSTVSDLFQTDRQDGENYHRAVYYLRLKVLRRPDGLVDILLAVFYAKTSRLLEEGHQAISGPRANTVFRDYARLSAQQEWKYEVESMIEKRSLPDAPKMDQSK